MKRIAVALILLSVAAVSAQQTFSYDFEQSSDFADYEYLSTGDATPEIVAPGAGDEGHCVRLTSPQRGKYCSLSITRPMPLVKNLVLSFDYRTQIEEGVKGNYLGILFFYADNTQFGRFDQPFSTEWRHAEVPIGSLRSPNDGVLEVGREFTRLNLYGRAPDEGALMTVWLDNIRLEVKSAAGTISDRVQTSLANPPLLTWNGESSPAKLQYSRSSEFPEDDTVTAATEWSFYTPEAPLEPGEWYWRTWIDTDLTEGWSETKRVLIPEEAHRFTTDAVNPEAVEALPRPRLVDVEAERAALDEGGIASLVAQARASSEQPIPDDPPIWEEGDERWPEWIDWYRDVHGGITSSTGRRLEVIARQAAITDSEEVRQWTLDLALAVASWDPEGGSAVHRGDIGAQHVLRGLNTAYDALHDYANEEDLATIRDAIVARAEDFWATLKPLRGDPQNNHTWLRALALGQSGLVLIGDYEPALKWAEYIRELYLGEFLAGMGFQGDNNEGLAYWSYGLGFIIEYADMMRTVCEIDLYQQPWLNQTARFPIYCAPPNAPGVSFADTGKPNHIIVGPYSQRYVRMLGERTGDPYALWYGGAEDSVDGVAPRPPVDLPQSILYRLIGLGVANTSLVDGREGVTVAMHSGPFQAGHQHADQNAFVINAYGDKLAIDSGYYDWYGSPHFKQYSIQTMAHNSILVDGEGQATMTEGADGRMAEWFDGTGHTWMVGDASDPDVYGGRLSRFDRRILFVKPGVIVIDDLLAAPEPASFEWLLHTVAPIDLDEPQRTLDVVSGEAAMRATMLRPADLSYTITDRYPVHPYTGYGTTLVPEDELAKEWHLTAEAPPSAEREFLTVFGIRKSGEDAADIREIDCVGGVGAQVNQGASRTTVLLAADRESSELASRYVIAYAEAAAVTTRWGQFASGFAVNASELRWRGDLLFAVEDGRADCSLVATGDGMIADVSLGEPSEIRLPGLSGTLVVDGEVASFDETHTVSLPAGEHTLAWGREPERALSHTLDPLQVRVGESVARLEGYARRRATDVRRYWWGEVRLPADDQYELRVEAGEEPPQITWDGSAVDLSPEGDALTAVLWDAPGLHHMTISAPGGLRSIALSPLHVPTVTAEMLPKGWSPPAAAVLHEAEDVAEEGAVKGHVMEKVAASGGVAHTTWDTPGQWASWRTDVPEDGEYEVVIRAASVYDSIVRNLQLDGELLQVASFASTGGWCRAADDWRWFRLRTEAGDPLTVNLAAGAHELRMEQLVGSMNLDLFALVPMDQEGGR